MKFANTHTAIRSGIYLLIYERLDRMVGLMAFQQNARPLFGTAQQFDSLMRALLRSSRPRDAVDDSTWRVVNAESVPLKLEPGADV